jgi:phosphoribosylanthranilate isomerase
VFVKICGITRPQDAELAVGLGASALGFVFWPGSPRHLNPQSAQPIVANVPDSVLKVGVFVDQPVEEVARIMDEVGLGVAQLHGHESPDYCRQLTARLSTVSRPTPAPTRSVIKAIGVKDNGSVNVEDFDPDILLLVDAYDPAKMGGTGKTVNWESARQIAATRRTILAGGLNAANVTIAVRLVRPFGVDVSSGVESAPGVKDPIRMRAFFEALHD